MFRKMRRSQQHLTQEEIKSILTRSSAGVLAVEGDNGYPYAVPLSFIYEGNCIYFHSANSGHKIDSIKNNEKVSFCIVDQDKIVPEELTTHFRSVIVFGRARIVEEIHEKRKSLVEFSMKYSPNMSQEIQKRTKGSLESVTMIAIDIDHISGKEALDMARMKNKRDKE